MLLLVSSLHAGDVDGPWKSGSYVDLAVVGSEVHAVWVEGRQLRYGRVGGTPETVATGVLTGDAGQVRPDLGVDAAGHPVVAWSDGDHIHLSTRDGSWRDQVIDRATTGHRELLSLAMVAGSPAVAWLDRRTGKSTVYLWSDGFEVLVYLGDADGVCMCCRPALFPRSEGLALAFRDADGPRRDIRMVVREAGSWSDFGDQTHGGWSPGGCPTDGPSLSETTLLVSDGRSGKRRVYEVSSGGERMLPAVDQAAEAVQPHQIPDASWWSWVESTPTGSILYAQDGPGQPQVLAQASGRVEAGDPVVVGTEIWQPWQGDVAHVVRVATQAPPMR